MQRPLLKSFVLGVASGLRTATPLASLAWSQRGKPRWLHRPLAKALTTTGAIAELVADKLPETPARTEPPLLIGRLVFGGLAGYFVRGELSGALVGIAGALAGTLAGYSARRALTVARGRPDLPVALGEDAIAVGLSAGGAALA